MVVNFLILSERTGPRQCSYSRFGIAFDIEIEPLFIYLI